MTLETPQPALSESISHQPEEDDDRDDEHDGENEAAVRETDENTEAPEEFEVDDEDEANA